MQSATSSKEDATKGASEVPMETVPNEPAVIEPRKTGSALLSFNQPVQLPSQRQISPDVSTRNFEPVVTLRARDPNMAIEDRRLTLGGDQRYMTEPSRMRYNEDVANRNMLLTISNSYPNPNPPATKSVPLPVGASQYGEEVADRVNALGGPAFDPAKRADSFPSLVGGTDVPTGGSNSHVSGGYYFPRFKPTQDAYAIDRRHSGDRDLPQSPGDSSSTREGRPSVGSIPDKPGSKSASLTALSKAMPRFCRPQLSSRQSSSESGVKKTQSMLSAGTGPSLTTPLTVEEVEAKEVGRMARDHMYDSRATHPLDRVRPSGPSCPVSPRSGEAHPAPRPRLERQWYANCRPATPSSKHERRSEPDALHPGLSTTPQDAATSPMTGPMARSGSYRRNTTDGYLPLPATPQGPDVEVTDIVSSSSQSGGVASSRPELASLGTSDSSGKTRAPNACLVIPTAVPFFHPEIVPPPDVFSSETTSISTNAPEPPAQSPVHLLSLPYVPATPADKHARPGHHIPGLVPLSFPPREPRPQPPVRRAPTISPADLKREKTWPLKFDTASGGYEGLEDVVTEKRHKMMVLGGLLPRTDTLDRSMPGGWYDGTAAIDVKG